MRPHQGKLPIFVHIHTIIIQSLLGRVMIVLCRDQVRVFRFEGMAVESQPWWPCYVVSRSLTILPFRVTCENAVRDGVNNCEHVRTLYFAALLCYRFRFILGKGSRHLKTRMAAMARFRLESLKSCHGIKLVLHKHRGCLHWSPLYAAGVATSQSSPGIHEAGLALQGVCFCLQAT